MNCINCGSPLEPGSNKCNVCGMEVEQPVTPENRVTNQTIVVPTFDVGQNNQQSESNGITLPNTPVQQSPLQSQPNQVEAPDTNPFKNFDPSILSLNPLISNPSSVSEAPKFEVPTNTEVAPTAEVVPNDEVTLNAEVAPTIEVSDSSLPNVDPLSTIPVEQPNMSTPPIDNNVGLEVNGSQPTSQEGDIQSMPVDTQPVGDVNPLPVSEGEQLVGTLPGQENVANIEVVSENPTPQAPLEEVGETSKKKVNIGLIVVAAVVVLVVAFFVFQYVSLTNQANKVKNNAANNSLNNKSGNIISEDAYETIAYQDANYVEYDFDYSVISDIYEHEYTIGSHKVKIAIGSDKTGSITINDNKQDISYTLVKIYHLLKSDVLFIENQLSTNGSELYLYSGSAIDNVKTSLNGSQMIDSVNIKDNTLEFTSRVWNENKVFNGNSSFDVCQDGYTNNVAEDFGVETVYTFDLKETAYSSDKLKSTVKKTVKEFHDEVCPTSVTTTEPVANPASEPSTPQVDPTVNQTPTVEMIPPVGE